MATSVDSAWSNQPEGRWRNWPESWWRAGRSHGMKADGMGDGVASLGDGACHKLGPGA